MYNYTYAKCTGSTPKNVNVHRVHRVHRHFEVENEMAIHNMYHMLRLINENVTQNKNVHRLVHRLKNEPVHI